MLLFYLLLLQPPERTARHHQAGGAYAEPPDPSAKATSVLQCYRRRLSSLTVLWIEPPMGSTLLIEGLSRTGDRIDTATGTRLIINIKASVIFH